MSRFALACLPACVLTFAPGMAWAARGASPYLPLNMSPQIERQIERVLILADKPVMSRPIAAAAVQEALPEACRRDAILCKRVRGFLNRHMAKVGLTHAGVEVAATDGASVALPNRRGMLSDSDWQISLNGHWQPNDYALLSVGGVAYAGNGVPAGSVVSVGVEYAQLDVGYRDHWFSPFTHSAMLIGAQAPTLPSATLSNYSPMTRLGVQYEVFLAQMDYSDRIRFQNGLTAGRPQLAGLRLGIEPAAGWSLSANRLVQFGGGKRGGRSLSDFLDALTHPSQKDNRSDSLDQEQEFGNQVAALTSRFIFPGRTPFSVYLEYAGEDTSFSTDYRLGNAALSIGLTVPRLWRQFDLTYEVSEWQNAWYVHGIYGDGLTVGGHAIGHWGADSRVFGDAVGAQTHMLLLGWEPDAGGFLQMRARSVDNESYSGVDYTRGYDVTLSYSRTIDELTAGGEVLAGRDVYGDGFSRLAGFVRFGDEGIDLGALIRTDDATKIAPGAEVFVDAGINANRVDLRLDDGGRQIKTPTETAPHLAIGARRAVSDRSDLGVRAELDRIDGEWLLAVRMLDYRFRFRNPLALSVFGGAARYGAATPAYGYYLGAGAQWRNVLPHFDLNVDLRYADKVARDKLLPSDPPVDPRSDVFYDITSVATSLSYRF